MGDRDYRKVMNIKYYLSTYIVSEIRYSVSVVSRIMEEPLTVPRLILLSRSLSLCATQNAQKVANSTPYYYTSNPISKPLEGVDSRSYIMF